MSTFGAQLNLILISLSVLWVDPQKEPVSCGPQSLLLGRCPDPATQVLWVNPCTLAGHCLLLLWITSSSLWLPASRTNPSDLYLQVLVPLCSPLPLVKGSVYVNLLNKTIQYSIFFFFLAAPQNMWNFPDRGLCSHLLQWKWRVFL